MIEDVVVNRKIDNPNMNSLSIGGWKNIVEVVNK